VSRRVAITGLGAVTPLGVGAESLIDGWSTGESGIEDGLGRCRGFDPEEFLTRKETRRADRFTQLALVASREALDQAGWADGPPVDPGRVGCIIGTGIGGIGTIEEQHEALRERGAEAVSPLAVPLLMANAASGVVAMRHGLKGQCYGTVSACAAGAHAIGAGLRMVQHGDAEACIVGGAEAGITPLAQAAFKGMGATSASGVSRPFDARRDGFVMGEGAGALVLERLPDAVARNARIHGELIGYARNTDAHHVVAPHPEGRGAHDCMVLALENAGISTADVSHVNAHGTSTPHNDSAEAAAIRSVFGGDPPPVTSVKGAIGHTVGAAGALEAVAALLTLANGTIPPTANFTSPDPAIELDVVAAPRDLPPGAIVSNSFAFGGHNAVLVFARL